MDVQISWFGVLAATMASMVIGALWYSPLMFGKQWQKLAGLTTKEKNEAGWSSIVVAAVTSFITAYVLAAAAYLASSFYSGEFLVSSILVGFYLWLGIAATTLVNHDTFERRQPKLTLMKLSSHLVTFLAMSVIIGVIGL